MSLLCVPALALQRPNRLPALSRRGGAVGDPAPVSFYTLDMCPYAQRVWIVLEELGVPYERVAVDLRGNATERAWYEATVNPRGKVPALVDGATTVYESLVCNEYLCDAFAGALLPRDAAGRASVRLWSEHCDAVLAPAHFTLLMNEDAATAAEKEAALAAALVRYEDGLAGPFLAGAAFTLADANAFPFFERLVFSLRHYRRVDALAAFPRTRAWFEACTARPSVAATLRPEADLAALYDTFLAADYKFGGLNRN